MKPLVRTLIVSTLVAATGLASAGPRYYGGPYHHHHHGVGLGGLVLGLAVAVPLIALANQADRQPEVVYVPPPPPPPAPVIYTPAPVYAPSRPAPVIYPRNGQSNAQLEADQRECNRWATTQQAAMADAGVFQRAVEACMDGRGYTLR
jgi:hypothetical protein